MLGCVSVGLSVCRSAGLSVCRSVGLCLCVHVSVCLCACVSVGSPALYNASHDIVNLARGTEPADTKCHVVGLICESGDILGKDVMLPRTAPGDVMAVANAGAYGFVMSSTYNMRAAPKEVVF